MKEKVILSIGGKKKKRKKTGQVGVKRGNVQVDPEMRQHEAPYVQGLWGWRGLTRHTQQLGTAGVRLRE